MTDNQLVLFPVVRKSKEEVEKEFNARGKAWAEYQKRELQRQAAKIRKDCGY
jgi:hypothetical protein